MGPKNLGCTEQPMGWWRIPLAKKGPFSFKPDQDWGWGIFGRCRRHQFSVGAAAKLFLQGYESINSNKIKVFNILDQ